MKRFLNALPPFVYVLAFWQSLAYVIASLVAAFTPYKLEAGVVLALFLALLKLKDITPQVRQWKINQMMNNKMSMRQPPE